MPYAKPYFCSFYSAAHIEQIAINRNNIWEAYSASLDFL